MTSSVSSHYLHTKNKVVEFYNLCGQQKYLKSTLSGMSGCFGDYGMLLINVNKGLTLMGKEHLSILTHLNIPYFIVITKMDLCQSKEMYTKVHKDISKELQTLKANNKSMPFKVNKDYTIVGDHASYLNFLQDKSNIIPIIPVSNRTGQNINIVKDFICGLNTRKLWTESTIQNNIFYITAVYKVKHVGIVLSGVVKSKKPIKTGDTWYLGPHEGNFIEVYIKSLHNDIRQGVDELVNGESGCVCITFNEKKGILTKEQFKKGMILSDNNKAVMKNVVSDFTAEIFILHHQTTIKPNFQSVIHLGPIRQAATINYEGQNVLRTGNVATVSFKWLFRPEYLEQGSIFFGREGSCRFCGNIISLGHSNQMRVEG